MQRGWGDETKQRTEQQKPEGFLFSRGREQTPCRVRATACWPANASGHVPEGIRTQAGHDVQMLLEPLQSRVRDLEASILCLEAGGHMNLSGLTNRCLSCLQVFRDGNPLHPYTGF